MQRVLAGTVLAVMAAALVVIAVIGYVNREVVAEAMAQQPCCPEESAARCPDDSDECCPDCCPDEPAEEVN